MFDRRLLAFVCVAAVALMPFAGTARCEQLFQLRNGVTIQGTKIEIPTLKDGFGGAVSDTGLRPIWLIDDGMRQHFIHGRTMVVGEPIDVAGPTTTLNFRQPMPSGGRAVGAMGSVLRVTPFNDFGRRDVTIRGPDGSPMEIIQGITEINPRYAKIEALKNNPSILWDMRVATASIDSATLEKVFKRVIDRNDLDSRLQLVRFFTKADRYGDASSQLRQILDDFPDAKDLQPLLISLVAQNAEQLLDEAVQRIDVGQRRLGQRILATFPTEHIGRVLRLRVEESLQKLNDQQSRVQMSVQRLMQQAAQLPDGMGAELELLLAEIEDQLSIATLSRLSDYERLGNSQEIPLENRVALAISGWLMGPGAGIQNLAVARSAYRVRDLVMQYLGTDDPARRSELIQQIAGEEAGSPRYIDAMAPWMLPAKSFDDESIDADVAGLFHVRVPGITPPAMLDQTLDGDELLAAADYHLQLPPEYDPAISYPVVVALHGDGFNANGEIQFWCGPVPTAGIMASEDDGPAARVGHAARNGFIVLAPRWSRPTQRLYEYTAVEHHRVLASLRHAMRRTSIDADRVYLAGHGEGATAAWDITLAHPDLWAGLIAVSGKPDKAVLHYETNSRSIPKYIVFGQLDADSANGDVLDDYMSPRHNAMVVVYRGRGRDTFYDEVPRMFQWMRAGGNGRPPLPTEFEVATMRSSDNWFWWLELVQVNPELVVDPVLWEGRLRAGTVDASIGADNLIRFGGPADQFRVHLRPMRDIKLDQPIKLRHGTRTLTRQFDGSVATILDDLAGRADRRRPVWVTLDYP